MAPAEVGCLPLPGGASIGVQSCINQKGGNMQREVDLSIIQYKGPYSGTSFKIHKT